MVDDELIHDRMRHPPHDMSSPHAMTHEDPMKKGSQRVSP